MFEAAVLSIKCTVLLSSWVVVGKKKKKKAAACKDARCNVLYEFCSLKVHPAVQLYKEWFKMLLVPSA